jgi:hypothetical protein
MREGELLLRVQVAVVGGLAVEVEEAYGLE